MYAASITGKTKSLVEDNFGSDETIAQCLRRRAATEPDTIYCEFRGESWSVGQLNERATGIAHELWALGLRPGDRVAVMLPTRPLHLFTLFALALLGLVRVPINIHLRGSPLNNLFEQLAPQALIADPNYREALGRWAEATPLVLWRPGDELPPPAGDMDRLPFDGPQPDDLLALALSSGTTGPPKGVCKSDRHLRAGAQAMLRLTEAGPGDVFLFWEQLHHGAGVAVALGALMAGFRLAMVERFSASTFWDDARACGATHVHYLGSVVPMLMKQAARSDDRDHPVRMAWGGGCPRHLCQALSERFDVQVREGYGLTELLTFVTINCGGPPGSIGRPLDEYELALSDEDGNMVAEGLTGEITLRARVPGLQFLGYFRSPEQTAASLREGWFLTGDLATQDSDGWLFYEGRRKDMLRRRGINVSAWEVEQVFASHPDIEEVALIGVDAELGDDELKLFVRLREDCQLDPLAILRWAEPQLAYFQVPRYLEFINEFPKTPTLRIQKKDLSRSTAGVWDLASSGYQLAR
jgi:crotonobetaine/carnitine-CoA ligase